MQYKVSEALKGNRKYQPLTKAMKARRILSWQRKEKSRGA